VDFWPERAWPRIMCVDCFEACGPEWAGPFIHDVEWSVDCGLEREGPLVNGLEWSVDCGPKRAGLRIMIHLQGQVTNSNDHNIFKIAFINCYSRYNYNQAILFQ